MSLVDSLHISYILAIKIVLKLVSFDITIIANNCGFIVLMQSSSGQKLQLKHSVMTDVIIPIVGKLFFQTQVCSR